MADSPETPDAASSEFRDFVGGLVPLEEARARTFGAFGGIAERIAGRPTTTWQETPTFAIGGGLLLLAAGLAALTPGKPHGSFWRVGRGLLTQALSVSYTLAPVLAVGGAVMLIGGALVLRYAGPGSPLLTVQAVIGGAGAVSVGGVWLAVALLAFINLVVMVLIIIALVVAFVAVVTMVIGMLLGLLTGG